MEMSKNKKIVCSICCEYDSSLSYFRIPTDERREAWIHEMKLSFNPPKMTRICSKHFAKNDFRSRPEKDYERKRLKKDAIPTLFLNHEVRRENPKTNVKSAAGGGKNTTRTFTCIVCGIRSTSSYSVHRFPVDSLRSRMWLKKLDVYEQYSQYSKQKLAKLRICSDHFRPDDFEDYSWRKLKRLKKDANPIDRSHSAAVDVKNDLLLPDETDVTHLAASDDENYSDLPDISNVTIFEASTCETDEFESESDVSISKSPFITRESQLLRKRTAASKENRSVLSEKENEIRKLRNEKNLLLNENNRLSRANFLLEKEIEELRGKPSNLWDEIKNDDRLINFYTNLPSCDVFEVLYDVFHNLDLTYHFGWKVENVDRRNQLLLTLMKLRLNFPVRDLAVRFGISATTVTNIFVTWLYALHDFLFVRMMKTVPSRHKNRTSFPPCFAKYPNCRMIVEFVQIRVAASETMAEQETCWSNSKGYNTLKGLLGAAPNGCITYASSLYPASHSDTEITEDCGVLKIFEPGDCVMANKRFLIRDILPAGVTFDSPPFVNAEQSTEESKTRAHIDRAIDRVKGFYILKYVPHGFRQHADKIWQTCAALTNLRPLLMEEADDPFVGSDISSDSD